MNVLDAFAIVDALFRNSLQSTQLIIHYYQIDWTMLALTQLDPCFKICYLFGLLLNYSRRRNL